MIFGRVKMRPLLPLISLSAVLLASQAFAGAWVQPKGKGQVIVGASLYSVDNYYTTAGHKRSQPNYRKWESQPYAEYGVSEWFTLAGNISTQQVEQGSKSNTGIGDTELYARMRLWDEGGFAASLAPMIKLPALDNRNDRPVIGSDDADIGGVAALGYSFALLGQKHFVNLDTGFRYRFGEPRNQLRLELTAGIGITDRVRLLPQIFATRKLSEQNKALVFYTQSAGDDYDDYQFQLSTLYKLNESLSLQVGAFVHAHGKNAGKGDGVVFAVWRSF